MPDITISCVTVQGYVFYRGETEGMETYDYTDPNTGWVWQIWRHKKGPERLTTTWLANVCVNTPNGRTRMLNTAIVRDGKVIQKDPLYDVKSTDPKVLLRAMIPLIAKGEWPKDAEL